MSTNMGQFPPPALGKLGEFASHLLCPHFVQATFNRAYNNDIVTLKVRLFGHLQVQSNEHVAASSLRWVLADHLIGDIN
jgi:hypothetical protein